MPCSYAGVLVAAVVALGIGCGGGTSCSSPPAPCGGDVTGSWKLVSNCPGTTSSGSCVQTIIRDDLTLTLTYTFANMMATETVNESGTIQSSTSASCYEHSMLSDCSQLNTNLTTSSSTCNPGPVTNGCTCTNTLNQVSATVSDAYSTSGTQITLSSGAATTTYDYCVQKDTLVLMNRSITLGGVSESSTSVFVFARM